MWEWGGGLSVPAWGGRGGRGTFRGPKLDPPLGIAMESAMSLGGGWIADGGIFHILETLQGFTERRKGGETGVKAVQMMTGDAVWKAQREGLWKRELLDAALARGEGGASAKPEDGEAVLGIVEYNDGFRGSRLALGQVNGE